MRVCACVYICAREATDCKKISPFASINEIRGAEIFLSRTTFCNRMWKPPAIESRDEEYNRMNYELSRYVG